MARNSGSADSDDDDDDDVMLYTPKEVGCKTPQLAIDPLQIVADLERELGRVIGLPEDITWQMRTLAPVDSRLVHFVFNSIAC